MKSFCGRDTPHFPHPVSTADRSGQCYGVPFLSAHARGVALTPEQSTRVEEIARKAYGGGPGHPESDVRELLGLVDVLCRRIAEGESS